MSYVSVKFLGNTYKVSEFLPKFVPILQSFDSYQESLLSLLVNQIKNNTYTGGADEDFIYWDSPIRLIAKELIISAAENNY